ncbi:DUF1380 family protein [Kluyvera ascorbata]
MYGTREELCVQLENMFTFDEPLTLLIWTEEGVSVACRECQTEPDEAEIHEVMQAMGAIKMSDYRREGITNATVCDLLARQRETANRQISVPAALLARVLRDYESELEHRTGVAWEAGHAEPESVKAARNDVYALKDALAA